MKAKAQDGLALLPPRRLSAGTDSMTTAQKEKILPYLDLSIATKNRVVKRDPIAGVGDLPLEHDALAEGATPRRKTGRSPRVHRDPVTGQGNLGTEMNIFYNNKEFKMKSRSTRNPITKEDIGEEIDHLRPHSGRPAKMVIRQSQRDPISGKGEFGREWDPIWKYDGRVRRWATPNRAESHPMINILGLQDDDSESNRATTSRRRGSRAHSAHPRSQNLENMDIGRNRAKHGKGNTLTGLDKSEYKISKEFKARPQKSAEGVGNPLTGENCQTYNLSAKLKEKAPRAMDGQNPVTGENCKSYTIQVEERASKNKEHLEQNPLTGNNCDAFSVCAEFKSKPRKKYVHTNPLTGENRENYNILPIMRTVKPLRESLDGRNAITGENCQTFNLTAEEHPALTDKPTKSHGGGNPVTGDGCETYNLTTEDKKTPRTPRTGTTGINPLTGAGVQTYDIDPSMRTNKGTGLHNGITNGEANGKISSGHEPRPAAAAPFNPITGEPRA